MTAYQKKRDNARVSNAWFCEGKLTGEECDGFKRDAIECEDDANNDEESEEEEKRDDREGENTEDSSG